jgi:hypothetical protein
MHLNSQIFAFKKLHESMNCQLILLKAKSNLTANRSKTLKHSLVKGPLHLFLWKIQQINRKKFKILTFDGFCRNFIKNILK